mmetsp:Transcript_46020/g.133356  ORF Transcript_46020/g.133356 Transcript_46020/m.133356 type:complete len:206 (-) Transcript_46020:94-711(-)
MVISPRVGEPSTRSSSPAASSSMSSGVKSLATWRVCASPAQRSRMNSKSSSLVMASPWDQERWAGRVITYLWKMARSCSARTASWMLPSGGGWCTKASRKRQYSSLLMRPDKSMSAAWKHARADLRSKAQSCAATAMKCSSVSSESAVGPATRSNSASDSSLRLLLAPSFTRPSSASHCSSKVSWDFLRGTGSKGTTAVATPWRP